MSLLRAYQADEGIASVGYVLPVIRALGGTGAGTTQTGINTPSIPTGTVEGDLLLTVAASGGAESGPAQSGYAVYRTVKNGTAATDSMLTLFWKIAGASETDTQVTGCTDHVMSRMIAIQAGTFNPSNPFNAESGGNVQDTVTAISITGLTSTLDNCLVLSMAGTTLPDANSSGQFSAWANSDLTSVTEQADHHTSSGAGGGIGIASGIKASAGAVGATTATKSVATMSANLMVAIESFLNSAPTVTVPGAQEGTAGTTKAVSGISVADVDSDVATVTASCEADMTLTFDVTGTSVTPTGNGTNSVSLAGAQTELNTVLATLEADKTEPLPTEEEVNVITVTAIDSAAQEDSDTITITWAVEASSTARRSNKRVAAIRKRKLRVMRRRK